MKRSTFAPARDLLADPVEPVEPGDFADPDLATVKRTRLEVERYRRRLREATPVPETHKARKGVEV